MKQIELDLVSISTLEAEVLKLRKNLLENERTIASYQGHFNADKKLIKSYKDLLNETFRVITYKECTNALVGKLLQRGLTNV